MDHIDPVGSPEVSLSPQVGTTLRSWAIFFYGVAVGLLIAWLSTVLMSSPSMDRLLIAAAVALAIGLVAHQRHVSLSKGRRWKKTT